jgi:hypothetical protein
VDTIFFMYANAAIALGILVQTTTEWVFRIPKSAMSTLLWSGARLVTARSVAVSVACTAVIWVGYTYFVPDDMRAAASRAAQVASGLNRPLTSSPIAVERITNISELPPLELPPLPASSSAPNSWDLIEGLSARVVQDWRKGANNTPYHSVSAVVSGQPILQLVAVGADRRHALGARFGELVPGEIYRVVAWVKAEPGVRVMIDARDSYAPKTEKPLNYGIAQFDLASHSVVNSTGDIIASGVDAAEHDWVKVWVDLRSRDGQIFALIGLLEGRNNRHMFTPAGQRMIFGGFEISPPRVVSQVSSPPPRTDIVTKVTTLGELPRLPQSSSAPNRWDLIEGLNAEELQGSAVVSSQRILQLVAVGAERRHALAARFGDLVPGQIYHVIAWLKAEPGVRVMIEARDSFQPNTGNPSNYGVAQFDLAARSVINATGDIIASGVDTAEDDWVKVWVDLRSKDGQIFALIGLLEGHNNLHVFMPAGQSVIFGGFEISLR